MIRSIAFLAVLAAILSVAIPTFADTSARVVSPNATMPQSDPAIHLDLSAGFTSEHGTQRQVDGIYNYGATIFKNVTPRLRAFFYAGDQLEDEKLNRDMRPPMRGSTPGGGPVQPVFGAFVYSTGVMYRISPRVGLSATYDQALHGFGMNGENVLHQINIESIVHVF